MSRHVLALLALTAAPQATAWARPQVVGGVPLPEVDWVQRYGEAVPLDVELVDSQGESVALGDVLDGRPAVLAFVYFECPMLCDLVLDGLVRALKAVSLDPGADFEVVVVGIDPDETPAMARAAKEALLGRYGRAETAAGWHVLTGAAPGVRRLADAVGFGYSYVPETDEYAHPAGVTVLTAGGEVSRYLFGHELAPRDLRLALVEAGEGAIGTPIDKVLLRCFLYDPARGRYGFAIMSTIRVAGVLTFGLLAFFVVRMLWRERRRNAAALAGEGR